MMEVDRIRKKLFDLPVLFKHYFRNKEYSKAKSIYDTARTVALFLEMEEKDMVRLAAGLITILTHQQMGSLGKVK